MRPREAPLCSCLDWCGDVPEEDDPGSVCKGLERKPEPPLIEIIMVPRDEALGR